METAMKRIIIGTMLILGGINAASADTWVFRDVQRPHGHDRSMAVKRADGRKCGARNNAFKDENVSAFQSCMLAHGWTLDHIIPDPVPRYAHGSSEDSPPVDNSSSNDDWVRRQQDQDNLQQILNTQQTIDNQQMLNDQQFQQNQQQMINNMNNQ
jgi:hypothetical protein